MDRSLHFYRDLLGMKLLYDAEREHIPAYDTIIGYPDVKIRIAGIVDARGIMICLMQYRNPPMRPRSQENYQQGAAGIAFEVADIDADYARLSAAGGIGKTIALRLLAEGHRVIVLDKNQDLLDKLVQECGRDAVIPQ